MDPKRYQRSYSWFEEMYFQDTPLPSRQPVSRSLPSAIKAARSLETSFPRGFQSREALFVKQGKLLANYEDEQEYPHPVTRYYTTYDILTNPELRGYFTWRTKLRRGEWIKTSASYAYLYIYELLNLITVTDAREGYDRLIQFRQEYGPLDESILPYLDRWTQDFVILHGLDPELLADTPRVQYHRQVAIFQELSGQTPERIMEAVRFLAPKWLGRSKFCKEHQEDLDQVLPAVLLRMQEHYSKGTRPLMQQLFGSPRREPVVIMNGAVFYRGKASNREYRVDPLCVYRCEGRLWTVEEYPVYFTNPMLENLVKAVDGELRQALDYGRPIQYTLKYQWLRKVIQEEVAAHVRRQKDAEARKLKIDFSQLAGIRRKAEVTRDALLVEEELWDEPAPEPVEVAPEPAVETCLPQKEYKLMQCLLYGRDTGWIRDQGLLLSVLIDSINERLYDTFLDTVVEPDGQVVEDYLSDLKEMILP